ncbi:MAG TPA: DUF3048 domain-containing protein [Candidatus Saccharimonadales bacterium]|nr:DUF3048 domain-containing protein [Candidatus Saccharimonadales bacterium]
MDDIVWPPKNKERRPRDRKRAVDVIEKPSAAALGDMPADIEMPEPDKPEVAKPELGSEMPDQKKTHWWQLRHKNYSKKQWALLIAGAIILIWVAALGGYKLYKHFSYTNTPDTLQLGNKKPKLPPAPTTVPSNLTGLAVDSAANSRQVTAIMIENSPDSRPQSGLRDAGIVFEAIAEGGITRFVALYQAETPDYIGPVRSIRPYYLDFIMPFDAAIAHVGGAPQALADIKALSVKDLDQFANSGAYNRIAGRYAPHNVYTNISKLNELENAKGFKSSKFTSFPRKKESASKQPTATSIDFAISGFYYNVHYDYDAADNSYKRNEGGQAHIDEKSGAQLKPKVVVALLMSRGIASDGQHTNYTTVGDGDMYVFQDGTLTQGVWHKTDRKAQFTFTDKTTGKPIAFNPGQTWVSIVDPGKVTYK